ncbi:MAG TPA: hypothetical protein VJ739_16435 [Gemmataceae bacterium]|nr:hypothetical protein [Gemmataceae bacterium]
MRCPVCRAENDQGPQCRRCRADLGLLFRLEEQRDQALAAARSALAEGDAWLALARLDEAEELRRDDESRRLRAVACLLMRDFDAAWRYYTKFNQPGAPATG